MQCINALENMPMDITGREAEQATMVGRKMLRLNIARVRAGEGRLAVARGNVMASNIV